MTNYYKNVYVLDTSTICGPYEKDGPLKKYFDVCLDDLYYGCDTYEKAEVKMMDNSIKKLLDKTCVDSKDVDLIIAGDLLNQICSSCYGIYKYDIPFIGIYSACATSCEGIIIASNLIEGANYNNIIVSTSSHNKTSEKQFRNPTEYGSPKSKCSTFTSTGGASIMLTSIPTDIRITSSTVGKICNLKQNDPNNMGACMAPAAADTIYRHLIDTGRSVDYYDLILTGDLGQCGKQILINYMKKEYDIDISKNYNDCGVMLYNLKKQKYVNSGGSGPVCNCLVNYSYIYSKLKKKKINKVLIVATGALFSPTFLSQHNDILSISHAVSIEVD